MTNRAFEKMDPAQWDWQTSHFFISETERELLESFGPLKAARVLEIGCGQGANLFPFRDDGFGSLVGLDLSLDRLRFARSKLPRLRVVCGDASALPFRKHTFDRILLRDVLHHLPDPQRVLHEGKQAMASVGQMWVIEPNGRNPIMCAWALVAGFDRGILKNSLSSLKQLFHSSDAHVSETLFRQPFPMSRVIYHYRFGLGFHGRRFSAMIRWIERSAAHLLPHRYWAYVLFRVTS